MLIVQHRKGPLAGSEQTFDERVERITFGRDPAACDVVFPASLTLVARRHFALQRKPSGEWVIEQFGDPYVGVNGQPAEPGQAVHTGDVIELGQPGGPAFGIVSSGKGLGEGLPVTAVQYRATAPHATARRARRTAITSVLLAMVAVVGTGAFFYFGQRKEAQLQQAMTLLEEQQRKVAADNIGADVRDRLLQGAYLVVVQHPTGQFAAAGTAFPIGANLLATNAHVAEQFNALKEGQKLYVRSPGQNGKAFLVSEVKLHPGYAAFRKFLNDDPLFVTSSRDCPKCIPLRLLGSLSYDVATIKVMGGEPLAPIIEIASRDELAKLGAGTPVGIAGYPTERIQGGEVQGIVATPNLRTGMISAMTDMFNMPGDVEHRRLIAHNIGTTGGNSGSPMLNSAGKLIGLNNSMNPVAAEGGGRMPNAAIINYGQRADLLLDLIEGKAEGQLEIERTYWAKQTSSFARGSEYLAAFVLEQLKPAGVQATLASEVKGALATGDRYTIKDKDGKDVPRRQKIHSMNLKAGSAGMIAAYGFNQHALQLFMVADGQILLQFDQEDNFLPRLSYETGSDRTVDIYVVSDDSDGSYRLMHYTWPKPSS